MTHFGASVESWLVAYLVNSLWQVPLLFVTGWMAARAVRTVGAQAEHCVWVGVLLLQSALPAMCLMPWNRADWQWLRVFTMWRHAAAAGDGRVSVVMGAASGLTGMQMPMGVLQASLVLYCVCSLYLVARLAWRGWMLSVIRREAVEVPLAGEVALCWRRCKRGFAIAHVALAASSRIAGPVTMGCVRKLLLMPAEFVGNLPEADLETVIAHEFAHMQRNDFLKNLLYECFTLPVAYHPLLWLTRKRLTESREMVCDQMAAGLSGPQEYARSLLRLAALLIQGPPVRTPYAIGIFDANTLERRLMKLNTATREVRGAKRMVVLAACAVFGVATCGTALALRMDMNARGADVGNSSVMGSTSTPKKVMIAAGVMAGTKLSGENPKYPDAAKKAKIAGKVVLEAVISKDGGIENLRVLSGPKELQASSLEAVRTWKYKPYLLNGDPIEVQTTINVVYALGIDLPRSRHKRTWLDL